MRILNLFGFAVFLMLALTACNAEKTPEELLCEKNTYEPYSVELFEYNTTPDTHMTIYFNREVSEEDNPLAVQLYFATDSRTRPKKFSYITLPLRRSTGRKLMYKIPLNEPEIDSLNTYAIRELFNVNVWVSKNEKLDYQYAIVFPINYMKERTYFFPDSSRSFSFHGMRLLTRGADSLLRIKQCFSDDKLFYLWSVDNYRYYNGKFNEAGDKEGDWVMKYSNGKPMIEGKFENNRPIGVFRRYNYYGRLTDSILPWMW